jgi:hypothetical protein
MIAAPARANCNPGELRLWDVGRLRSGISEVVLRRLIVAVVAAATGWALVSTASASSPPAGAHYVQFQATSPTSLFIDASYSGPPILDPWHHSRPLSSLGCSFRPASPSSEAATSNLALRVYGWTSGDLYDPRSGAFSGQRDALRAQLAGSILDAARHRYTISGSFFDDGSRHVLAGQDYYGVGQVTIGDSTHTIAGNALLYRVSAGDDSWSIDFTHIDTCT